MEKNEKARSVSTGPQAKHAEDPHKSTLGDLKDQAEALHQQFQTI